jgi:hypothetical protein
LTFRSDVERDLFRSVTGRNTALKNHRQVHLACDSFFATNRRMFLSVFGVLLVSFVILVVVAIVAKLTLGD